MLQNARLLFLNAINVQKTPQRYELQDTRNENFRCRFLNLPPLPSKHMFCGAVISVYSTIKHSQSPIFITGANAIGFDFKHFRGSLQVIACYNNPPYV